MVVDLAFFRGRNTKFNAQRICLWSFRNCCLFIKTRQSDLKLNKRTLLKSLKELLKYGSSLKMTLKNIISKLGFSKKILNIAHRILWTQWMQSKNEKIRVKSFWLRIKSLNYKMIRDMAIVGLFNLRRFSHQIKLQGTIYNFYILFLKLKADYMIFMSIFYKPFFREKILENRVLNIGSYGRVRLCDLWT